MSFAMENGIGLDGIIKFNLAVRLLSSLLMMSLMPMWR